jgi:predicted nucleic acid-binding protein
VIVTDASVLAVALGDDGPDGDLVRERLKGEKLAAPEIIDLEVVSVWRRQLMLKKMNLRRATMAMTDLKEIPIYRSPHKPLLRRCLELQNNISVYDASYVALAEILDSILLTADVKLTQSYGPKCNFDLIRSGQ